MVDIRRTDAEKNGNISNVVIDEIEKVVKGKRDVITKVYAAILAGGHILLDDIPGVGKTTLAMAFAKALDMKYNRVQFTPDVLPSDIMGFSMYNAKTGDFEYREGAAFCNLFLADEINRTSSKTQAALLEAMAEGTVTAEGNTYKLPNPFITIATQNPITSGGTQALPDSQLDRFMVKLSMGYPDVQSQMAMILEDHGGNPIDQIVPVMNLEQLVAMRTQVAQTYISQEVAEYISLLVDATRHHDKIECGISPRGTKAFANLAKACAYMNGRNYVIPNDVSAVIYDVFMHRLVLTPSARREKNAAENIVKGIVGQIKPPAVNGARK